MSTNRMFTDVPTLNIQRSRFPLKFNHKTTFNAGQLVPLFYTDLIPGSSVQLSSSAVVRMGTTVTPPMDNCAMSLWWFFCPYRIIWNKWKNFNGELESDWESSENMYRVPAIRIPEGGFAQGSVADHFGLPTKVTPTFGSDSGLISALPFRAFGKIYNEWFRDQNLQQPLLVPTDDVIVNGSANITGNYLNNTAKGGALPPLARPHDLFGSALPFPQKGDAAYVNLMSELYNSANVPLAAVATQDDNFVEMRSTSQPALEFGYGFGASLASGNYPLTTKTEGGSLNPLVLSTSSTTSSGSATAVQVYPTNLAAQLEGVGFTINELRASIAFQHLLELRARSGSRYREILHTLYGVEDPNPLLDIPTYIAGKRFQISVTPVVQQSASVDGGTPQGTVTGYSHTGDYDDGFVFSNTEGGCLICCCGVRNEKTYQNGIDRQFKMFNITDFYNPMFAGLGESAVYNSEIFLSSGSDTSKNDGIFGYMPSFYWQVNRPNIVSGQFRSNADGSLAFWHYADNYSACPVLGPEWIADNSAVNIDRVLAVSSSETDQFLLDFEIEGSITCSMPAYDVPGMSRI